MSPAESDPTSKDPSRWHVVAWAASAGFVAYFAMYAFRKPFTAAEYADLNFWGTAVELKTAFVVSQVIGYALSKYIGIDLCSRVADRYRAPLLLLLILLAEAALVLFAVVPISWKVFAIFLNGLPLGMVWGVVVRYLEGRRTSDLLLAILSCSFIVSSGVVKDVGRWWLGRGIDEFWMPSLTGLCFLPLFLLALFALSRIPAPTSHDIASRTRRHRMSLSDRKERLRTQWHILWPLLIFYVGLTAYRDFRDNYAVEILGGLGYAEAPSIFSRIEFPVGITVTLALGALILIQDHRRGLIAIYLTMAVGMAVIGASTLLLLTGAVSGITWMIGVGIGAYLAYVPFGAVLFERLTSIRGGGTAVFGIYIFDALGYTGSVALQLYKDVGAGTTDRLSFFQNCSLILTVVGIICLAVSSFALKTELNRLLEHVRAPSDMSEQQLEAVSTT